MSESIEARLEKDGVCVQTTVGMSMYPMLRNRRDRVVIRPVDEKAVARLIKMSKGQIKIPGIEYKETVSVSIRT